MQFMNKVFIISVYRTVLYCLALLNLEKNNPRRHLIKDNYWQQSLKFITFDFIAFYNNLLVKYQFKLGIVFKTVKVFF